MADDDDAWSIPTTSIREVSQRHGDDNEPDTGNSDFDYDIDHTQTVQGDVNKERWVKVFGFTNLDTVLHEFEKIGKIERYKPAARR